MPRLFVGGHRELRRPVNLVDESLMRRIEDARQRLRLEGKDIKPVRRAMRLEAWKEMQRHGPMQSGDLVRAPVEMRAAAANDPL